MVKYRNCFLPFVSNFRIDEPEGDQIYYCNNCNCRVNDASTSGDDEEFSDDAELQVQLDGHPRTTGFHLGTMQYNSSTNTTQLVLAPGVVVGPSENDQLPGTSAGILISPPPPPLPLPAPIQSPRTPGPSTSSAGANINNVLARIDELGWQETRPALKTRASFLLNNSRMSDVKFLVGESKIEIYGHKTLLALGSPVFEAQFYGAVGQGAVDVIELPDMEPDTFLTFLKVLNCFYVVFCISSYFIANEV